MQQGDLTAVKSLLLLALQQPESEREKFVSDQPDCTPGQKQETIGLLRAQGADPSLLDLPLSSLIPGRKSSLELDLLAPGDVLAGRYLVEGILSRTPNSQVFLASDMRLAGNQVALKLLPIETDRFKQIQDQLWREVESLARLHHPSVSGLIDTGLHDGYPYLVTQFYPGLTLDQWIEVEQPSNETRLQLFQNLVSTVEVIHRAGLLHLDLKPHNIIVSSEPSAQPTITILDFGIAAVATEATGHRAGTPHFSAPERSSGRASAASDVYSLARIGSEILPSAPTYIQRILTEAMHTDPSLRPQSASAFSKRLNDARNRRRRITGLAAILIPAALVSVALMVAFNWKSSPRLISSPILREITSMRGIESDPVFSPDGATVYFRHESKHGDYTSIWKTAYAGGEPQVQFHPPPFTRFSEPNPTPDGKYLFFVEAVHGESSYIVKGDLKDNSYRRVYAGRPESISLGSQSHLIYFSEESKQYPIGSLMMLDLQTGAAKPLVHPPSPFHRDIGVAISPDGKFAVFVRYRTTECSDLMLLPLTTGGQAAGSPFQITSLDRRIQKPRWLADSRTIVFAAGSLTNLSPWKAVLAANPLQPASAEPLPEFGTRIKLPEVSPSGDRILFVRDHDDSEIYRLKLDGGDRLDPVIASTSLDEEPRFSPDGQSVAFFSERSGSLQGWTTDRATYSTPRRVTNFEMAEKAWPSWNTDGAAIFYARIPKLGPEIHLSPPPFQPNQVRRIFSADHAQRIAGIGVDGASIFVEVVDSQNPKLERWSLLTDHRELVTTGEVRFAREFHRHGNSGDRIILYAERKEQNGLFLIENGLTRKIYPGVARRSNFTYRDGHAYLVSEHPKRGIYKVDIRTGKALLLAEVKSNPGWGMDISPDGKELLVSLLDFSDSNIVAAEWPQHSPFNN